MKFNVQKAQGWVTLAVYSIILLSLLRPGGTGQSLVQAFGEAFAGIPAAS
jgi:hypothetical protein